MATPNKVEDKKKLKTLEEVADEAVDTVRKKITKVKKTRKQILDEKIAAAGG